MKNVYELNPELKAYEIDECSNFAQEKLIAYAEEQGHEVSTTIENGEVYLRGEYDDFFENNAQVLFDEYFAEKAEEICAVEFKTAKENGQRFDDYDYNDCEGSDSLKNAAYDYITERGADSSVNIDIGDDGVNVVRITAIMPDNTGYDFSEEEIEKVLQINIDHY